MPVQTSIKLTIAALSFSLLGCKASITAEDAIKIGRKACEATQKREIPLTNDIPRPRIAPADWKAILDGRDWWVTANDLTYFFTVKVTASGKVSECKLRHMDA
jgi:hypothetical protein